MEVEQSCNNTSQAEDRQLDRQEKSATLDDVAYLCLLSSLES